MWKAQHGFVHGFWEDGRTAIDEEAARMQDPETGLDAELRRIRAQEALDSVEGDAAADEAFFATLVEADELAETQGERSLNSWVTELLQFGCRRLGPGILKYTHDLRTPTFVPLFEAVRRFDACIDWDPETRDWKVLPMLPVTFERAIAETKRISLLRVGHPFVDAFEALVRSDDRGTAFAMWRYVPRVTRVPRLFFRFDFVVEADLAKVGTDLDDSISLASLRRRADEAFPVEYRTVWLNGDLAPVQSPQVLTVLGWPYQKSPRANGSRDVNLRIDRWERVDALVSIGDWGRTMLPRTGGRRAGGMGRPAIQRTLCPLRVHPANRSAAAALNCFREARPARCRPSVSDTRVRHSWATSCGDP